MSYFSVARQVRPEAFEAEDQEDVDPDVACLGVFGASIVGVQYYSGTVNNKEMVGLVREPNNPYDRWAIRVDNIRGQQVGHLPRVIVCHLSPLLDAGLLDHVEGVIPRGKDNAYKIPVDVYCYGRPENRDKVLKKLARGGLLLGGVGGPAQGGPGGDTFGSDRIPTAELEASLDRLFQGLHHAQGPRTRLPACSTVTSLLYPHQQEALAWMVERENHNCLPPFWEPHVPRGGGGGGPLQYINTLTNFISTSRPPPLRGGILADDMGLGKTLTVIALLATNRPGAVLPQPITVQQGDADGSAGEGDQPRTRKRKKGAGGCEGAGPSNQSKGKLKGKAVDLLQSPAKPLPAHIKELESAATPPPSLPAAGGPRGTLIVCPTSVLSNWQQQIAEHTDGSLKVHVHHGASRSHDMKFLRGQDVVITSYGTLAQEAKLKAGGLLQVPWLRVVLDEAHNVKNAATQQSKAVQAVQAERRWAVSGTPIQNNLLDLFGLLAFLRLEPLHDKTFFMRTIDRPIKFRDARGLMRLQVIMNTIALRRTKELRVNGRPIVELPPKTVHFESVALPREEREVYDKWETAGRRIISRHLQNNTLLQNYTTVLEIILRMRQICDSASLVPKDLPQGWDDTDTGNGKQTRKGKAPAVDSALLIQRLIAVIQAGGEECPVCLNDLYRPVITSCGHVYCHPCIEAVINKNKAACPLCRSAISPDDLFEAPVQEAEAGAGAPAGTQGAPVTSAKVSAVMVHVAAAAAAGMKSVVFSQFTGMLNLMQRAIESAGIAHVRLDGATDAKTRAKIITDFGSSTAGSPLVFLTSLRAGGVGLNLTAASAVHLIDPWWNPAVEEQAMDRVHRLGQTREVHVYRYVVEDSIEERMLALQENKRQMQTVAFEKRAPEQMRQMRLNDIKLLMEL